MGFNVKLMPVKIGYEGFSGGRAFIGLRNAYAGVDYAIANKANVISMSWGRGAGGVSLTEQLLFDVAFARNIVCVAAAGNSNTLSNAFYPASYNRVISVASSTASDSRSGFSNYGTLIDVTAPGSSIYSTVPGGYGTKSGTSMACPLVSGLCALMLSFNPNLTVQELEACLKSGCDNIDAQNPNFIGRLGAGRINAENALACLKPVNANFTVASNIKCPGDVLSFSDKSFKNPTQWQWTFTGGVPSTSSVQNPQITYPNSGVYDVKLVVTSALGKDSVLKQKLITIATPTAKILGNVSISLGASAFIKVICKGLPNYRFTITNGTDSFKVNTADSIYYHFIKPNKSSKYWLSGFKDASCAGTMADTIEIDVLPLGVLDGPGGVGKTNGNTNLQLWLMADKGTNTSANGQFIDSWKDQSGANNDVVASNAGRPVFKTNASNGKPSILFNGSANFLQSTNANASFFNNEATVFVVMRGAKSGAALSISKGISFDEEFLILDEGGFHHIASGNYSNKYHQCAPNMQDTLAAITSVIFGVSAADIAMFNNSLQDNVPVTNSIAVVPDFSKINRKVVIGQRGQISASQYFNGEILEVIGYNEKLNDADRKDVENYLRCKYAVQKNNCGTDDTCISNIQIKARCSKWVDSKKISLTEGNFKGSLSAIATFGVRTTGIGDIDKDGIEDMAVSASTNVYGGSRRGSVFILLMNANGTVKKEVEIGENKGGLNTTFNVDELFGSGLGFLGDFDKDGVNDIVVGSRSNDGGTHSGALWLCYLKADGTVKSFSKISRLSGNVPAGIMGNSSNIGFGADGLGDIDGDGVLDIISSSYTYGGSGAIWIWKMNPNGTVKSVKRYDAASALFSGLIPSGSGFGIDVSKMGDFNKDGLMDIAITSYTDPAGGANSGALFVCNLDLNGDIKTVKKLTRLAGLNIGITNNYYFGFDINHFGDLDLDGNQELFVSGFVDDAGGIDRGAYFKLNINAQGDIHDFVKYTTLNMPGAHNIDNADYFGSSIGLWSNKNDTLKLMIGARGDDDGANGAGAVYINVFADTCYTKPKGDFLCQKIESAKKLSNTVGGMGFSFPTNANFGYKCKMIGDIDKDGVIDMAATAPMAAGGKGEVILFFMNANGSVKSSLKIAENQNGFNTTLMSDEIFGNGLAAIGDFNKDGVLDIAIGSRRSDGGSRTGAIYLCYLNSNGTVKAFNKISKTSGGLNASLIDGSSLMGLSIDNMGDFDNNGTIDLLVGGYGDNEGGFITGAAWLLLMNADGTVKNTIKYGKNTPVLGPLINAGSRFGISVIGLGDLNNDGVPDIGVSSYFDNTGGTNSGAFFVINLKPDGSVLSAKKHTRLDQADFINSNNYYFGIDAKTLGDINNNGNTEVLFGCFYDNAGGANRGAFVLASLNNGGDIVKWKKFTTLDMPTNFGFNNVDMFGSSLDLISYKNDTMRLIVGCRGDDDGAADAGAVYIITLVDTCFTIPPKNCELSAGFNFSYNCLKDSIHFMNQSTDAVNSQVSWSYDFGDGNKSNGIANPKHLYTANGSYTVKLIAGSIGDNGVCLDSIFKNIIIKDSLSILLSADKDTMCLRDSVQFSAKIGCGVELYTYSWLPAAGLSNSASSNPKAAPTATQQYVLTVTDKNGLTISDSITIVLDLLCCKSHIAMVPEKNNLCVGDTLKIANNTIANGTATYQWQVSPPLISQFGFNFVPLVQNSTGFKQVKLILNDDCGADTSIVEVLVQPKPFLDAGADTLICLPDTLILGTENLSNLSYQWSPINGIEEPNIGVTKAWITSTTKYYLSAIDLFSGCSAIDSVVVEDKPLISLNLGVDKTICETDSVWLSSAAVGSYLWSNGSTSNAQFFKAPKQVWLSVTSGKCEVRDTIEILADQVPVFSLGGTRNICQDSQLLLQPATLNANYTYNWNTGSTGSSILVTLPGTYSLSIQNGKCVFTDAVLVNVLGKPQPFSLGADTLLCLGDTIRLMEFQGTDKAYGWQNAAGGSSFNVTKKGIYSLIINNQCGLAKDEISIEEKDCSCTLFVPTAFTPNGDGLNDVFLPSYCDLQTYEMQVYSRWGEKVFESKDINKGWDGKIKGEKSNDVYYWLITAKSKYKNQGNVYYNSGTVYILSTNVE